MNIKIYFRRYRWYKQLGVFKGELRLLILFRTQGLKFLYQTFFCRGYLRMPPVYADQMILQQGVSLKISGEANSGEWITVSIQGQSEQTCCQSDGHWQLELTPLQPGGPFTLEVFTQKKKLIFRDVYVGEVWLCSGQSNMVFPIAAYLDRNPKVRDSFIKEASNHKGKSVFRFFQFDPIIATYPVKWPKLFNRLVNRYCFMTSTNWKDGYWPTCLSISATAYFYGKQLSECLQIPVGIIINAVGGSAEYNWIERSVLQKKYPDMLSDWYTNTKVTSWMKGRAIYNLGREYTEQEQLHPYHPSYCYEVGIRPIKDFHIKGVIWHSGESSAQLDDFFSFEKLQELLVHSWRKDWGYCFPFYYVQLQGVIYKEFFGSDFHYYYPEIRDSQRKLLEKIPLSGMAVSHDLSVPDNNHINNRKPLSDRLVRLALHYTYGRTDIIPSGPLYRRAWLCDKLIYISFDWSDGLCTSDGKELKTFEVAGGDLVFYPAQAKIESTEIETYVVAVCDTVGSPCWIRYAFGEYPIEANLINGAGLPAACFKDKIEIRK